MSLDTTGTTAYEVACTVQYMYNNLYICDRILENLPFWHIGQSDGNHLYLLGKKAFGVKLHSKKV